MAKQKIYLDHAATTPVHPDVLAAMLPYFGNHYGNPNSLHSFGRDSRRAIEAARDKVAALICADSAEIIFTSGGTEADNLAIQGITRAHQASGGHIITSAIEHHAVLNTCAYLESTGFRVSYLAVDERGTLDPAAVEKAICNDTILITIMHANNEVGTIEPIAAIGRIARQKGVLFHTDAVQSAGKIPIDVRKLHVDLLSLSSHKIYGPKGVGALYVRSGVDIAPIQFGGGHERGLRSGTEHVSGIIGFGKTCEIALRDLGKNMLHVKDLRDCLEHMLLERIPGIRMNGYPDERLPHILSVSFEGLEAESIVASLDVEGIYASAGAACTTSAIEPSHVLTAMRLPSHLAFATVRFSLGWENTKEEISQTMEVLEKVVTNLRRFYAADAQDLVVVTFADERSAVLARDKMHAMGIRYTLAATPSHMREKDVSHVALFFPSKHQDKVKKILEKSGIEVVSLHHLQGISSPMRGMELKRMEHAFWDTVATGKKDGDSGAD